VHDSASPDTPEPRRTVGVVVNPERTEVGDAFVRSLHERGVSVRVEEPDRPDDLAHAVERLVDAGVDTVAAIGGDGTQRTVAAALVGRDGVSLAVVPGGTVNLLARVLGVDDVERAAHVAVAGRPRPIDLGRADDDLFVLNGSTGWDAATIGNVDDGFKRFGRVGYAAAGVRQWVRTAPRPVAIRVDGEDWYDGDAQTVLVLNVGQRGSSSVHLAPDAELDDGRLDVAVLRRGSVRSLVRTGWAVLRGRDPLPADVRLGQGGEIEVAWDEPVAAQLDGDEIGATDRTVYASVPAALSVLVPED
jgi:YegS/Rv2252/BmrU family lipid kinase